MSDKCETVRLSSEFYILRVANVDDTIYVDLDDSSGQAIRITAAGWELVNQPPVMFILTDKMKVLPIPEKGGNLEMLWNLFPNLTNPSDRFLILGWLLATLRGVGPYPILILNGEQGSGKSTLCQLLRSLVDPHSAPLRSPPKDERDLLISAFNNALVCQDNVSHINPLLSDAFCRIATGEPFVHANSILTRKR